MLNFLVKNFSFWILVSLFGFYTIWWIFLSPFEPDILIEEKEIWSTMYWVFAVFGGVLGLFASRGLGFTKSLVGRIILAFSVGLLLQAAGQIIDSYLSAFGNAHVFYPSISEIGYTGSIFAYIYGTYILARYVGVADSFKSLVRSKVVWAIPILMFLLSYFTYLYNYDFENLSLIHPIFDFGYPILQSIYVAFAVFVLVHAKNIKEGVLRKPIGLLLVALIFQYLADSHFVYEYNQGVWYSANLNDYIYLVSYFFLAVVIVYLDAIIREIYLQKEELISPSSSNNKELYNDYIDLLKAIIKSQEEVIGPLAWTEVAQVENIIVKNKQNFEFEIIADPKATINLLLDNFYKVFGPTALYVAKRNTYRITKNMQVHQVPEKLL